MLVLRHKIKSYYRHAFPDTDVYVFCFYGKGQIEVKAPTQPTVPDQSVPLSPYFCSSKPICAVSAAPVMPYSL